MERINIDDLNNYKISLDLDGYFEDINKDKDSNDSNDKISEDFIDTNKKLIDLII